MAIDFLPQFQDRIAIEELRYRFGQALDYRDWDLLASLLEPTVDTDYAEYGLPAATMQREQLLGIFEHTFGRPGLRTQHQITNLRIQFPAPDRAICISNFTGHHFLAAAAGPQELTLYAEYTDQLVKRADGWRISGLRLKVFYLTGDPSVLQS